MEPIDPNEHLIAEWEWLLSREGLGERIYKKQIRQPRKDVKEGKKRSATAREIVIDSQTSAWVYDQATPIASRAPESAIEALMRAGPHQDPLRDKEASQELKEAMLDAMEMILGEETADVVARRHFAQTSIAELAAEYGVAASTMGERLNKAERKLADQLIEACPEVAKYLHETSKRINP
jgi:DNA-directed RNA polymerase specialized sigma24 family protein